MHLDRQCIRFIRHSFQCEKIVIYSRNYGGFSAGSSPSMFSNMQVPAILSQLSLERARNLRPNEELLYDAATELCKQSTWDANSIVLIASIFASFDIVHIELYQIIIKEITKDTYGLKYDLEVLGSILNTYRKFEVYDRSPLFAHYLQILRIKMQTLHDFSSTNLLMDRIGSSLESEQCQ